MNHEKECRKLKSVFHIVAAENINPINMRNGLDLNSGPIYMKNIIQFLHGRMPKRSRP